MLLKSTADTKQGGIVNIFSVRNRIPKYKLFCKGFCGNPSQICIR